MKKSAIAVIVLAAATLLSCAPVLKQEVMKAGSIDVPFGEIRKNPEPFRGQLFILGGIIVNTRLTEQGSLIEAAYVKVDTWGYLKWMDSSDGRFLALCPKECGILEPTIYRSGRKITMAGVFIGTQQGKIDEMDYLYPVFEIKDLYLWDQQLYYTPPPYTYPLYWWDYPYPYWGGGPYWYRHYYMRPYPYWW